MSFRKKAVLTGLLITLAGIGMCTRATEHGVGLSRDSVSYLHYARVLLHREPARAPTGELAVPLSHYPPLYPATLAALTKIGLPLLTSARVANIVCYGLLGGLSYWIVLRGGGSLRRAAVVAFMVLLQPGLAFVHLWGCSEPTFLLLTAAVVGLLAEYASHRGRGRWIAFGVGAAIAAASFQRYIGPAFLPAALFVVWRCRHRAGRWLDMLILTSSALLPVLTMAVVQRLLFGEVAHRTLEFIPLTGKRLIGVLETLREWLADPRVAGPLAWELAALFLVTAIVLVIRFGRRTGLRQVTLALTVSYTVLLILSVMFVDNGTPLDRRILSPLALLWTLWLVAELPSPFAAISALRARRSGQAGAPSAASSTAIVPGIIAAVILACITANDYVATGHFVDVSRSKGFGFSHKMFRVSMLPKVCRGLPDGATVVSNFPEAIWLYGDCDARALPGHPTALGRVQKSVDIPLTSIRKRLRGGKGYVAYFDFPLGRGATLVPVSIDELKRYIPLQVVQRFDDGLLLRSTDSLHADYTKPLNIQPSTQPAAKQSGKRSKRVQADELD